jgi:outer membrane protein OmpA-like peptidoglycan-associated protein
MQIKPLVFAVTAVFAAGLAQAQSYPVAQPAPLPSPLPQAATPGTPKTADQWVGRMTDFTQNASAFKDPAAFAAWANAMTDPSMVPAMGMQMMEPGNLLRSMTTMVQPGTTGNYMQFMDPSIYMKWGGAMMNPMWYTQMATSMADPGKMMRWVMMPMDPKMWSMGMQAMNPNLYMKWMMTPTDPRAMSLMFAPMNPQLYGSMMGGVLNPQMMGGPNSTWGTFMYPKQPVVSVQGAAPVASPINVFDPSTWFSMLNMFGGMPTMPTMGMPFAAPAGATYAAAPAMPFAPAAAAPFAVQAGAPATLSIGGDALFKTGKSSVKDLTPEGRAKLDDLVAKVKAFGAIDSIKVTGHADKMGKAEANKKLSLARAKAVAAYLKSKGVKAKTFATAGLGDAKPVVECDMNQPKDALKACLAPNRRVEIEVTGAKK